MGKDPNQKPWWACRQDSKHAVHWLIDTIAVIGDLRARKPSPEVACGYALDRDGLASRTTRVTKDVTCWDCAQRAGKVAK